jgi:5-methylcytosine-specific restriction protein A
MKRACLDCGAPTTKPRCEKHARGQRNGSTRSWRELREQILARDRHTCRLQLTGCTTRATHVDHIVALANGGTDHPTNLVAACQHCNLSKGTKTGGAPPISSRKRKTDTALALRGKDCARAGVLPGGVMEVFNVRLSPHLASQLDELAALRGMNRSTFLRTLIAEAAAPTDGPDVPSVDELLMLLSERARAGHVSAIRTLIDRLERRPERLDSDALRPFDQLDAAVDPDAARRWHSHLRRGGGSAG